MGSSFSRYHGVGTTQESALSDLLINLSKNKYFCIEKDFTCFKNPNKYIFIEGYGLYLIHFKKVQNNWISTPEHITQ